MNVTSSLNSALGLPPPHIKAFLIHAARHSPYYREQDWAKNLLAGLPIRLQDIPVTAKSTVQENPQAFRSEFDPPQAGPVHIKHTSGSTGVALAVAKSSSHFHVNQLENQRLLAPWKVEGYRREVEYRPQDQTHPVGTIETKVTPSGKECFAIYTRSASDVAKLVREKRPDMLAARPSQILSMLEDGNDYGFLKLIRTTTEAIPDELRTAVQELPHCLHLDLYGAVETGLIAANCPVCGNYHLAHANLLLEILDDSNEPAKPGTLGRVVATVFSNPAMPLIRYDLGDLVRLAEPGSCARGEITLEKIYGRERMVFRLPAGGNVLPAMDPEAVMSLGIRRFKMLQTAIDKLEFLYQMKAGAGELDQDRLRRQIAKDLSPLFKVKAVAVSEFPLAPSGKYLMHERLIP